MKLLLMSVVFREMPLFSSGSSDMWSWSWFCNFGLGLKNLVLFTSLVFRGGGQLHHCILLNAVCQRWLRFLFPGEC